MRFRILPNVVRSFILVDCLYRVMKEMKCKCNACVTLLSLVGHDLALMSLKLHAWSLCSSKFPTAATLMVVTICGQS